MRQLPLATWGRLLLTVIALGCTTASGIRAQEAGKDGEGPRFLVALAGRGKPVPTEPSKVAVLASRVSLAIENVSLTQALAMISRQTGVEFVYGPDAVGSNRRVSLHAEDITLAGALTEVLFGAGVDVLLSAGRHQATLVPRVEAKPPVAGTIVGRVTDAKTQTALAGATVVVQSTSRSATTGNDGRYRIADVAPGTYTVRARYIGYAPGSVSVTVSADQEVTADVTLEKSAQRLDEVVTTGTVVPTEVKALPTPISIITADDIQRQNLQRVDQVFRGQVPGAIAWDQGPNDYNSTILIRGATALTVPTLKTYIDGVEMSDPQYIAVIDPNSIDRIEITRGPQASTLYGAGALSGVMQIFTKKGQLGLTRPQIVGKVSVGGIGGYDGQRTVLQTDNTISILSGGAKTSYNIGGSYGHTGEWVSSYRSTNWSLSAGWQTSQGPLTLSALARYGDKQNDLYWDPRLAAYTYFSKPYYQTNPIHQQTYGLTTTLQATRAWQHTLTLGYDQTYTIYEQTRPRFTTPADSFLSATDQHQARTSLLYHSDLNLSLGRGLAAVITAGVNYDVYSGVGSSTSGATSILGGGLDGVSSVFRLSSTNTGYFAQAQLNIAERLFVTGGLRAERDDNFGTGFGTAWSPRIGAAYVLGLKPATVKLRASYGESIRAPDPGQRDSSATPFSITRANPNLAPERQRGGDAGVEVYLGKASVGVTYYNQRAIDLIQSVLLPTPAGALPLSQYQNVARVKNEGWEFEGRIPLGPVQLSGTYSITSSTVQQLPPSYTGSYQVGDRIDGIPHTTAGATVTYSPLAQTTLTASMTYIGSWRSLDILSFYAFAFGGQPYRGSTAAYYMDYPAVAKFAVGASQVVRPGLTAFVRAENVGNNLRYEQYNIAIPKPRSVLVGVNVRY